MIEKGVVGIALWLILAIFLLWSLKNTDARMKREQLFILFALAIIFLRELSFPVLLTSSGLQVMLALLLGIYVNNLNSSRNVILNRRNNIIISAIVFAIFAYCSVLDSRYAAHTSNIENFKTALEKEEYDEAEQYLSKCRKTTPTYIYYSILCKHKYLATDNRNDVERSRDYLAKAIGSNPLDMQLRYDYAMTLWMLGEKQEAKTRLEDLCKMFPNNSLMLASLGNILCLGGDKKSAISYFARAIELTPSLLETDLWKQFEVTDSISCRKIRDIINDDMRTIGNDPIKQAKFGKIMYLSGDYERAEELLTEALTALPNLVSPWVSLWRIESSRGGARADEYLKKAKLLGFDENEDVTEIKQSVILDNAPLPIDPELYSYYGVKFQRWYATPWYSEIMVY